MNHSTHLPLRHVAALKTKDATAYCSGQAMSSIPRRNSLSQVPTSSESLGEVSRCGKHRLKTLHARLQTRSSSLFLLVLEELTDANRNSTVSHPGSSLECTTRLAPPRDIPSSTTSAAFQRQIPLSAPLPDFHCGVSCGPQTVRISLFPCTIHRKMNSILNI
jgi:hypothetical protein